MELYQIERLDTAIIILQKGLELIAAKHIGKEIRTRNDTLFRTLEAKDLTWLAAITLR